MEPTKSLLELRADSSMLAKLLQLSELKESLLKRGTDFKPHSEKSILELNADSERLAKIVKLDELMEYLIRRKLSDLKDSSSMNESVPDQTKHNERKDSPKTGHAEMNAKRRESARS